MNNQPFTPEKQARLDKLMEILEEKEKNLQELLDYGDKMIARHQLEVKKLKAETAPK